MPSRPRHDRQFEFVFRRAVGLPVADQVRLIRLLAEQLDGGRAEVSDEVAAMDERAASLEQLRLAADQLGLPAGKAPNSVQYGNAAKELGLWSTSRIVRAWSLWRHAASAYEGRVQRPTAAQRALWRRWGGRTRDSDEYVAGLRAWLDTGPLLTTSRNCDEWVIEENARRDRDDVPRLVRASTLRGTLHLPWRAMLAVARGETTLADAQAARAAEVAALGGPYMTASQLVDLLDAETGHGAVLITRLGFPPPAVVIGRSRLPGWDVEETLAWKAGERFYEPDREPARLCGTDDFADVLGVGTGTLTASLHPPNRALVPLPDGRCGHRWWWMPESFERWKAEREAAQPGEPTRAALREVVESERPGPWLIRREVAELLRAADLRQAHLDRDGTFPPAAIIVGDAQRVRGWDRDELLA